MNQLWEHSQNVSQSWFKIWSLDRYEVNGPSLGDGFLFFLFKSALKGHFHGVTKCDMRDKTGAEGDDRHHIVRVSMLGRSTHQVHPQSSSSPTVDRLTLQVFHILPKNAHTIPLKIPFIFLVPFTVMADFLIDSNPWFFSVWVQCLFFFLLFLLNWKWGHFLLGTWWHGVLPSRLLDKVWRAVLTSWRSSQTHCTCGVWSLLLC